jgi:hypothetical protein
MVSCLRIKSGSVVQKYLRMREILQILSLAFLPFSLPVKHKIFLKSIFPFVCFKPHRRIVGLPQIKLNPRAQYFTPELRH